MDRRRFFIVGATASAKGRLALEIARRLPGEVISVDSMKVYRGMDVGTAKPSAGERREVPFHLIDIREPEEPMSVAEFIRAAEAAESEILSRKRLPVFEGGTALYVRGLTEGVFEGPAADRELRERHAREWAAPGGREALHGRLRAVDPEAAARLHPNDLRRVSRALEVFEKTGRPISALQAQWAEATGPAAERVHAGRLLLGLRWPKEELRRRIDARVDRMFEDGFVEEARALLAREGGVGREAFQALGYRELFRWLRSGADPAELAAVRAGIQRDTRRFAKRQLTFWRHFPDIRWIDMTPGTNVEALALRIIDEHKLREMILS